MRRVCTELTGRADGLRPDVVDFYARETLDMIGKFRSSVNAEGGVA